MDVYIYALKDGSCIFYVGKTQNVKERKKGHIRESFTHKREKDKIIQNILTSGRELELVILEKCSHHLGAEIEKKYIKKYGISHVMLQNTAHNSVGLNELERQMLILMSKDMDTSDMAQIMFRSERTLETMRQKIKAKAGQKTISGLMTWAYRNGYIII